ncbi:MAG: hypothetical protein HY000_26895 [Planctomycetes bacterium]|nr:hypothetical protein [Planctomycetota bacterium]
MGRELPSKIVLLVGCLLLGLVALYPPRRERLHTQDYTDANGQQGVRVAPLRIAHVTIIPDPDRAIRRSVLFADNPHRVYNGLSLVTEIDTGRLVAEAFLIVAGKGFGVAALGIALVLWKRLPNESPQPTGGREGGQSDSTVQSLAPGGCACR